MKKYLILLLAIFTIFTPLNTFAISSDYEDKVYNIVNVEKDENKVNLYLFYGQECPHCEEEREWLEEIKNEYKDYLNVYEFEVWHNDDNKQKMETVKELLGESKSGVPFTVIGDTEYVGYSETIGSILENKIKSYSELDNNPNKIKLPLLGTINAKDVSIPVVAVILGLIDGFNPCAMWILLFLINMLFGMKDKKRAWILGYAFLLTSGVVYFLSMIGINFILGVTTIQYMKLAIAIFILAAGILNLKKYLKTRKENAGCTVVDEKKRKNIVGKMKKIKNSDNFIIALLGIIVLATTVNLIELACSLGFPVIFTEILNLNNINGITKIIYLLIYIVFYLLDDIIVFTISMFTLEATGITNKYNKLCTLISAIIMIIMGLLLIIKPEWLMLNF